MVSATTSYIVGGVFAGLALIVLFILYLVSDSGPSKSIDLSSPTTHVIITGGSSGIGFAAAKMIREKGASVTIIARDQAKLNQAKSEIEAGNPGGRGEVFAVSADVGDRAAMERAVQAALARHAGRVDVIIASAGVSRPGRVDETPTAAYESMARINYLGAVYSALAVIPAMKRQGYGRILMVSSLAGLTGLIGFAGYSPSKYAVRGLAQVLQMELRPFGIYTSLVNPPDVDTPMLADEMQYKPEETKIISEGSGLFKPEDIAKDMISAIRSWRFMVNTGFDGWLLGIASADLSTPSHSFFRSLAEVLLASPLRIVGLVYLYLWNGICTKTHKKRM